MKVHIKYYAKYADYAGTRMEDIETDIITLRDLLNIVRERHPKLKEDRRSLIAINDKFVGEEAQISDGATVSIFPPVSGG